MGLFIAATIFTIALQVVLHVACAILSPPEAPRLPMRRRAQARER